MILRNQTPKGGTELQFEFLRKHVDPAILNQVEIEYIVYRYHKL